VISRWRVLGCKADMLEYRLPVNTIEFPARFLQVLQNDKKTDLRQWAEQSGLFWMERDNSVWLHIPESRRKFIFNSLAHQYPSLKLPEIQIKTDQQILKDRNKQLNLTDTPVLMGILNVTPDSFSDGGLYNDEQLAVARGLAMAETGAQIIDIGGESTRPGAAKVTAEEEWERIGGVIRSLAEQLPNNVWVSVDTYKSDIADKALQNGANIINDISGLTFDPVMADIAAEYAAPVILMHIKGTPENMQQHPRYIHVMDEILDFFDRQIQYAVQKGVKQLILDPGIGFGKRLEDNFEIIRRFEEFSQFGYPTLLGLSRKSFMWRTLSLQPHETDAVTLMMNTVGLMNQADILRVHHLENHRQMKIMWQLYQSGKAE